MIRITRSIVLDVSAEQLWPSMRDFGAWAAWHEKFRSCRLQGGTATGVGAVRVIETATGERLSEQLIALSDQEMSATWCLVEASGPRASYVMSLRLRRVTHEEGSFIEWSVRADAPTGQRSTEERLFDEAVEGGFGGLRKRFPKFQPTISRLEPRGVSVLPLRDAPPPLPPREPMPPARGETLKTSAVVVERHGGPEVLGLHTLEVPPPGPGEIRLRHAAIGVNMIDVHGRQGEFGLGTLPAVPGMEAAGTVLDVGPGVSGLRPGDRVIYAGRPPGAYCTLRTMPADIVVPLPLDIDERTAAACFLKGITADLLLHDVHPLRPGEIVLIHAAAGGLGLLLCGWAKALGATVVGVVSTDRKVDAAAEAGCAAVIVSSREDSAEAVREMTRGRGVDVVFDAIGRATFEASLASLAPRGHLVSFGQVSGPVGARDIDALATRSIRLSRPNFSDYTDGIEALRARAERLFAILRSGQIRPRIDSEWPLGQAAEAHRRLQSRDTIGSVLLVPDGR